MTRPDSAESEEGVDPLIGTVINEKFAIRAPIARGGMGRIYYATQVPFDRPVALKVVQADGANEEESKFLKRFLKEASILAKMQHPNVVMLFDYGRIEGSIRDTYFMAMEYLDGDTLAKRLKSRKTLPTADVLLLLRQVARGLREAHSRGIIHRDLKPANIILVQESDGGELVKIVDFGIGKEVARGSVNDDLTKEGILVGTPRYMAPEQFDGEASPASDLYALGTILFQALTGQLPYTGESLSDYMVAKFARPIPRFQEVNPEIAVPGSLEALTRHLLARLPEERPSMEDLFVMIATCEEDHFGTPSLGTRALQAPISTPISSDFTPAPGSADSAVSGVKRTAASSARTTTASASSSAAVALQPDDESDNDAPTKTAREERRGGEKKNPLLLAFVALVAIGGVLVYLNRPPPPAPTVPSASSTDSAPRIEPSTLVQSPTAFVLMIDSSPAGATVFENDKALGTTPLQIAVERASVAESPRTFIVQKDGYLKATLIQGPSVEQSVRSVVALAADPAGTTRPITSRVVVPQPTTKASTAPSSSVPGLDIRGNR